MIQFVADIFAGVIIAFFILGLYDGYNVLMMRREQRGK